MLTSFILKGHKAALKQVHPLHTHLMPPLRFLSLRVGDDIMSRFTAVSTYDSLRQLSSALL